MAGFGDALRHARANRGVTLTEVERAIRIPRKYLRALEDEDFAALPAGIYSRGIVRNYAQYLHLDPDDAISYFEELRGNVSGGFKVVPAVRPMEVPSHWAPNFALIAFVVVISAVLFAWLYSAFFAARDTAIATPTPGLSTPTAINMSAALAALTPTLVPPVPPTATAAPPTATPPPLPTAPPTAKPSSAPSIAPQAVVPIPRPASNPPQRAVPTPTPIPPPATTHAVTIQALEAAWVTVTVDGVIAFNKELAAGETRNFEGRSLRIQSGRATVLYLWIDGDDYGLLSEDSWLADVTIP